MFKLYLGISLILGGLLETNNQLERFTKDKKNKKIMYSILGILLIIVSRYIKRLRFMKKRKVLMY